MHQWKSDTLQFIELVDLANHVIGAAQDGGGQLGPYTLLTVDEGYVAVTQNNGKQVILEGGRTHMLTHRNWKFQKFMSQKIQTDDLQKIRATTVKHANAICGRYGVEIIAVNIISAFPKDEQLLQALAKGAVAAAEAEQAETAARGRANALRIQAEADASAEQIRAQGSKAAAHELECSSVAVELARMKGVGSALDGKTAFFFGAASPSELPAILGNPAIVKAPMDPPAKSKVSSLWG